MPQQALIDLIAQNLTQRSSSDRITGVELREVMYTLVNDLYGEFLTGIDVNTELNLRFKNRGLFSDFIFGLVSVNDVFYDANGIAYYCIQAVAYSPVGSNPPLTDTDYYKPLTNVDISRKITFIDWESDLTENYSVIKGQIVRMNGTGGDASSEYWYIVLQDYTGTKTSVNPLNSRTYYFDITGHTHTWGEITSKPNAFTPSSHSSTHTNGTDDIQLATASQKGLMSSTYASKLDGIAAGANVGVIPNASITASTKTKITYDSKGLVTSGSDATTDDIQEGVTPTNKWWTNSRTISSVLTAFSSGAGTVSASDTILQAIQKIVGNIGSLVTGVSSVNTKTGAVSITTADVPDSIGKRYQTETQNTYNDATSSIQTQLLGKLPIPTLTKTVPIDTDSLIVKDSEDGNKYKDVLKSNINEVYVGDSAPSHNEKVWIDNTADLLVYKSSTTATITPNNTLKVDKYNSNYSAGNTVAVSSPTFDTGKHIDYDDDRVVVIKNTKAGTVTFVLNTLPSIIGGITYNYIPKNGEEFDLAQNNYGEISYLYTMTSATTCDVLIRFAK